MIETKTIIILTFLILILLFIIFLIIRFYTPPLDEENIEKLNKKEYENYELEIICGSECTNDLNCRSFSYNPLNKKCSLYDTLKYDNHSNHVSCNKIQPLLHSQLVDDISLTKNTVYYCNSNTHPDRINSYTQNENRFQYVNNKKILLPTIKDSFRDEYYAPKIERYNYINY
tara:strand:+ start:189 stop:704 length:516 start_codon:yes stop_codon:yes gene_type:complete